MFKDYQTSPFFDEMFTPDGKPKAHYEMFHEVIKRFSNDELKEKHETAQLSFLRQGITFTVYHNNVGTERTMPFDFVPIIIPPEEWEVVEKGMTQRAEALNRFLDDVYHEQKIIEAGIVTKHLVEDNPYYYKKQMQASFVEHLSRS